MLFPVCYTRLGQIGPALDVSSPQQDYLLNCYIPLSSTYQSVILYRGGKATIDLQANPQQSIYFYIPVLYTCTLSRLYVFVLLAYIFVLCFHLTGLEQDRSNVTVCQIKSRARVARNLLPIFF